MRKLALLLVLLVLVAGCGTGPADSTPSPSPLPTEDGAGPAEPAVCVESPLDFTAEPRIPPVTEEDHVHGPADAPITFIEYADFQ